MNSDSVSDRCHKHSNCTHTNVTPIWFCLLKLAQNSKRQPKAAILLFFSSPFSLFLIAIELAGQFNREPSLRNNVILLIINQIIKTL